MDKSAPMEKLHFDCDYMRGAHPEILRRLCETNLEQTPGYGSDEYCAAAEAKMLEACGSPEGKVFFLTGGTQTNATVLDAILDRHEGVLCADTAHIAVHEAGAVEASGHKVITLETREAKISPQAVETFCKTFYADETYEHQVAPGAVYISQPTEFGTLYSLEELKEIRKVCDEFGMRLYADGARLGYALASPANDASLKDIASLCDVFYIGGTKVGAMMGEAVVFPHGNAPKHFFSLVKRHGALLAKGRLLGIQFLTLFTDGLYVKIAGNAIDKAIRLRDEFKRLGIRTLIDSPTNQQFFVMSNSVMDRLAEKASFEVWGTRGESETAVRFVSDWATTDEEIDCLVSALESLVG